MKLKKKLYTLFEKQISVPYKLSHLSTPKKKKKKTFTKFWWFHTETTGTSAVFF
jgi:hypothetical protein